MATHDLSAWQHTHSFDPGNRAGESRTWIVVAITAVTMVAEIVAGWITGSMALLADGWHMATHVVALSIAGIARDLGVAQNAVYWYFVILAWIPVYLLIYVAPRIV